MVEINYRLCPMTATDDRLHFVDFSGVLSEDHKFRSDGVHLTDAGIEEFARCIKFMFQPFFGRSECCDFWIIYCLIFKGSCFVS